MVYSLFSCHKCACGSHPILTFLTFHEIDFATNVPSVLLFTRNIFGSWLYLLMPFHYRYDCMYTHMPSLVWIVWIKKIKLHIVQSVALGVCFSIFDFYKLFCTTAYICIWQIKPCLHHHHLTQEMKREECHHPVSVHYCRIEKFGK